MSSCLCSWLVGFFKLLIFSVNGMLCYFLHFVVQQGNVQVFRQNIDKNKVEVRVGMKDFLATTFKKFCHNLVLYET
jgi:hypothetical protein